MSRVVYAPGYNIGFLGLERLHPFDSRKFGRAWKCLQQRFGASLQQRAIRPDRPVDRDTLLNVHEADYLDQLTDPAYVADALELPPVRMLPYRLVDHCILRPMRWAVQGTIEAARASLTSGFAVNLGGGFHHAKPAAGEGFCVYSDIALAVHTLRAEGRLGESDRVAYIDLDAHLGNGVCHVFRHDPRVFLFDMYNSVIYPCSDIEAVERVDCGIRLTPEWTESEYLDALRSGLPAFLDSVSASERVGLAIYNAGTDVFAEDPLGMLAVSAEGILERDLFVAKELRRRGIPGVMLTSGGYTRVSYRLVADSVTQLLKEDDQGV